MTIYRHVGFGAIAAFDAYTDQPVGQSVDGLRIWLRVADGETLTRIINGSDDTALQHKFDLDRARRAG